jgi:Abortive infection alpha
MDEISKQVIETSTEVALRPFAKVIEDGIGAFGGDRLSEYREEKAQRRRQRRQKLGRETTKLLVERGVEHPVEPHEPTIVEIFDAAQDENRPELEMLWARLLAAAIDPTRANRVRREFIEAVKQFDPLDALVLQYYSLGGSIERSPLDILAQRFKRNPDEIAISLTHLAKLDCVMSTTADARFTPHDVAGPTAFGRELLRALYS